MIEVSELRKLVRQDELGRLYWLPRPSNLFSSVRHQKRWNTCFSGKLADNNRRDGYKVVSIFNKQYLSHRIVWAINYGSWPTNQIDHINGNRSDNVITNLRQVDNKLNSKNQKRSKLNTSGVTGVYWYKKYSKWKAQIMFEGKSKHLGYFEDIQSAIIARKQAEQEFGFHNNHGRK